MAGGPAAAVARGTTSSAEPPAASAAAEPRPLDDFLLELAGTELRATPLARKLGRDHGVDLRALDGSGPRGRVQAADVTEALRAGALDAAGDTPPAHDEQPAIALGVARVPFTPTRRVIAERLVQSVQTAPHFYLTAHVEMTALRAALAAATPGIVAETGARPGLTVALARIAGIVLARHPLLNASVDGAAAALHAHAHIGIAMDRDGELCVPVLRDAGTRSFVELTVDFARLRDAVQARTIQPADMRGGTFTISNLGMHGVDAFTAIINPPQSAILAVGRTVDTPVGRDGAIVLRPMATLSLSSDHRIVDGITAARFMADLRRAIEQPDALA
jgi:pyruvate dehydrogenase E2 component (dihydrolipoamide acetyltransferase)